MTNGPTREEFERLYRMTEEGFSVMNAKLEKIGERIGEGEVNHENVRTRLVSIEKEVFHRRHTDTSGSSHTHKRDGDAFFTRKEKALIALGITTIAALIKAAWLAGGATLAILRKLIAGA
jgi:hypothetical protein